MGVLNTAFGDFSVPEKSEGFDEVIFDWQAEAGAKKYLKTWVLDRKRISRVENLKPSQWFNDKLKEWQTQFAEFQAKLEKPADDKKEDKKDDDDDEEKAAANKIDIFSVTDVCDVGEGKPLFKLFAMEDWALMQLRFDLYLLNVAFKKDVNDPERVGIHETHLSWYYNRYFRKQFMPKYFGVDTQAQLIALVPDAVGWSDDKVLTTPLTEDAGLDMFVKLTEEKRRERQRRLDAGDETARLKFMPLALSQQKQTGQQRAPAKGQGKGEQEGQQEGQQQGGKWSGAGGGNRSAPYGQGAYGQGGFQARGAGGNKWSGGGGGGGGGGG